MSNNLRRLILAIAALNLVSAAAFIFTVRHDVYDDFYNMTDVHAYATNGVSVATIQAQTNAPGPLSFIWIAEGVRILGGDELMAARISALLSWVLLIAGVLVGARYSRFPAAWHGALLATLVFPHAATAAATVLTEGPALFFAVLGLLLWFEFAMRFEVTWLSFAVGMFGGLFLGLSVVGRQYFLAVLPAAAMFAFWIYVKQTPRPNLRWVASVLASLAIAAAPPAMLILVWRGISSPRIASGASYANWQAHAGLSFDRPVVALFYVAFYLLLLTFPVMSRMRSTWRWFALVTAIVGAAIAIPIRDSLLQPGPLHSFVEGVSRIPGGVLLLALIVGLTIYNLVAFGFVLWGQRGSLASRPLIVLALFAIAFFVLEQFGVGGNLPLYERYLLQFAPFLGLVAFSTLEDLRAPRVIVILAMAAVGQIMLWRYAFSS